ncbi:MAG: type II toxin-antitoxin system RelE/ParE family toxin [Thermococci archaeon]|nr:type II toxin-antitoxin system RelE/ParE family toxin [Thermococci archaeon]
MVYTVLLHRNVLKGLKDAPESVKRKFGELVEELKFSPLPSERFDVKKLRGRENTFRVRLGEYRVISTGLSMNFTGQNCSSSS